MSDLVANELNQPACNPRLRSAEKSAPGPIGTIWLVVETSARGAGAPIEVEVTEYTRPNRRGSCARIEAAGMPIYPGFLQGSLRRGLPSVKPVT
jgi:hypothetical protein